jgi:hypothetical protein
MNFKTILIIVISVLVTVVLMNNTDEIDFWLFGEARIPKLTILGSMFGLGLIVGFLVGKTGKKNVIDPYEDKNFPAKDRLDTGAENTLSEEDRDYIR